MPIVTHCPACNKRYELNDEFAGRRARCKDCGAGMQIPVAAPAIPRHSAISVGGDEFEGPRPKRAKAGSSRTRRNASGELPPLVKIGLWLAGALIGGSGAMVIAYAVIAGRPELALPALAILSAFFCAALVVVSFLKLIFLAAEESQREAMTVLMLGPVYLPFFVARRWKETWRLAFNYTNGVVGLILWFIFVPPTLQTARRPAGARGPAARSNIGRDEAGYSVTVIVNNLPPEAREVVAEKIKALVDPGGNFSFQATFAGDGVGQYSIAPVSDPQRFADRITFGQVTSVWGRQITVAAAPVTPLELAESQARKAEREPKRNPDVAGASRPGRSAPDGPDIARPDARPAESEPAPGADRVTTALFDANSQDRFKRSRAVKELARMAPIDDRRDEVRKTLQPMLDDQDGFFVNDVITAMAAWVTKATVPALIPKTADSRFGVRWHAIEALGKLKDARAAEAIVGRLREDGIKAEPALREMGPSAEQAVLALLSSPDADLRRRGCNILKDIGGKTTLKFMGRARPDPDNGVQMAAREAIQAIVGRVGPISK
jgi:hypothetical protein